MGSETVSLLDNSPSDAPTGDLEVHGFCIGAAKSGSTWLSWVLDQHPEIQVSDPKETNFFTKHASPYMKRPPKGYFSTWGWYSRCFSAEDRLNIDFSVHTMADPGAPRRIRDVFPYARFFLILRDPVRRLYSHYRHELRVKAKGVEYVQDLEPTFERALENDAFTRRSRYAELLEPWLKAFPKDRFHLITTEAARRTPLQEVQGVFRFLGVDDSFCPRSLDRRIHPHRVDRGVERFISRTATWARRLGMGWLVTPIGRRFPWRFINRIDKKKVDHPPLDPGLEAKLREQFLPDIEKTERMFDVDLGEWKPPQTRFGPPVPKNPSPFQGPTRGSLSGPDQLTGPPHPAVKTRPSSQRASKRPLERS